MKRALAIAVALCTLGVAGFAQLSGLSGSWSQTVRLTLPAGTFSFRPGTLVLNFAVDGWTITGTTIFSAADQCNYANFAFVEQDFGIKGAFGPFNLDAGMKFNAGYTSWWCEFCDYDPMTGVGTMITECVPVTSPSYMAGWLTTSLDFAGITIGIDVQHYLYPFGCLFGMCDTEDHKQTVGDAAMLYTFSLGVAPLTLEVALKDCCTGIQFAGALITLDDVGLCCGITFDAEVFITKETGFEYALFSVKDFFNFCCGISFDLYARFTVTSKEVELHPKWAGIEACATIYADYIADQAGLFGLHIYGYKLACSLTDCYKVTFLTVLEAPPVDPETCYPPSWYSGVFSGTEYEYIQFDACGAGCCGGKWTAYFRFYFGATNELFDLSRFRGYMSIPVMSNLAITSTWTYNLVSDALTLDLGWKLTF
ncbi:MAG TPA: hypothetical protein PKG50_04460 [Candidatus Bipolaricaulis anaerobius]|nr:hypothetical protein [Candidatus Bipolaricaulis anaerobius]HNS23255.1 hypothetical protein [Candidatus Bipolaricaulis anaerobius]